MATVTLTAEADVSVRRDSALAAGLGDHLPVGYWSGAIYRAVLRFPIPAGWTGWSSLDSATLNIYVTDHAHVGVRNSQFYVRRGTWTKAAGTQDCESGYSGGNTSQDSDVAVTSTGQVSTNSGSTVNLKRAVGVLGLVSYFRDNAQSKIVLVLDPVSSADYMEFWSREHGSYPPTLVLDYSVQTNPDPPTLVAPAVGATVDSQTPTFSWTPDLSQGPQTDAAVILYDAAQNYLDEKHVVVGSDTTLVWPYPLARGTTYKWTAWTTSNGLDSANPVPQSFTVRALPTVAIFPTRYMEFAAGAPRLRVTWNSDSGMTNYRVQTASPVFDSGWLPGNPKDYLLDTVALTDNVPVSVTVSVRAAPGVESSTSRSFTPRYGLTTHRKDLVTVPLAWASEPTITATGTAPAPLVVMEYGSAAIANATPTGGWYSSLSAVPKRQFLYWRAWFIPSATVSPTLDKVVITTNNSLALVDKWYSDLAATAIAAPWVVATDEYVYGTRSITVVCDGTTRYVYSARVKVRAGRTYILTGLMKSTLAPGGSITLIDPSIASVTARVLATTPVVPANTDWYDPGRNETIRYRSPIWIAPADMDVVVALTVTGPSGAQAWFEAIKLEESTVATPWSPGAVGATVVDAGGVQVDGSKGGVFRYKGTDGAQRSVVAGGTKGLLFAGDTELESPSVGVLAINGVPVGSGGGGGAPTTADYLVGTAQGGLSAEIVVGATPGGELGGTWAAPTVDATHSGSTHAAAQSAAEATAAAALTAHGGAADPHTGYRLESADHSHASTGLQGGQIPYSSVTGTPTIPDLPGHVAAADPHIGYRLESADHSHATSGLQAGQIAHSALSGIVATDHHAAPAAGPDANATVDAAGAAGTAGAFARSGHGHQVVTDTGVASTQAFGDAATAGTSGTIQRGSHKHAMPADPVVAHVAAADPHPVYLTAAEGNAAYQPLDSDLTAIAALATTSFGRGLLALADAAALSANHSHASSGGVYVDVNPPASPGNGQLWWDDDDATPAQVAKVVPDILSGTASVGPMSGGNGTATVTFSRAFATAPVVVASTIGSAFFFANASATTTQITVYLRDIRDAQAGTGTLTVNWVAVGVFA